MTPATAASAQSPPESDDPDGSFVDSNCDGIDGDLTQGILVSGTAGDDSSSCGLDFATPCRTIDYGMTRAAAEGRDDLFVMAGAYNEVVTLSDGIRIFGGYDADWVRGDRSESTHRTLIRGGLDTDSGQYLTVNAHDLTVAPTLDGLVLVGPDASGAGASTYVVHAARVPGFDIVRATIQAGNGVAGADGTAGVDAPMVDSAGYMNGVGGGNADYYATVCDDTTRGAGGPGGNNRCTGPGTTLPGGGGGGVGGKMDADCSALDYRATPGGPGGNAAYSNMMTYVGVGGLNGTTCGLTGSGYEGRMSNGRAGIGAMNARGLMMGDYWVAASGSQGGTGENGSGGGGGAGSGGCDAGTDAHGAGGGGGGAGGCAALAGGGRGGGGGGSFGVFAVDATLDLSDCDVVQGDGGAGGAGGVGGRGQSGGAGAAGGLGAGGSGPGGRGAAGAHGGHGGGGGGGAGGVSMGIFSESSTIRQGCAFSGGSAGTGGAGGASAPTAPAGEQDGNDGTAGVDGIVGDVDTCAMAGGFTDC